MKKIASILTIAGMLWSASALANVTLPTSPIVLPVSTTEPSSSGPIGLFKVSLSQDAGETLSSVNIIVNPAASSTLSSGDISSASLYRDNGDGTFNINTDSIVGTQSSVGIGTSTLISAVSNNTIGTSTVPSVFFVAVSTGANFNAASGTPDSFTVTLPANAFTTSANSPTISALTSAAISADNIRPTLLSVVAKNTGGTAAKEASDSLDFTFSEPTNHPTLSTSSLTSDFIISNGHSLLDSLGQVGGVSWNASGTVLTVTLSGGTASNTIPNIAIGDLVTSSTSTNITDMAGNTATGSAQVTGSFGGDIITENNPASNCTNGLINGRLYTVKGYRYVYLAAACRLKLFKGKSLYRARGNKFHNIINLDVFPPAGTTLTPAASVSSPTGLLQMQDQDKPENHSQHSNKGKSHGKNKEKQDEQ